MTGSGEYARGISHPWIKKGLPHCLIGDSGTGKSHLLIALGIKAATADFHEAAAKVG